MRIALLQCNSLIGGVEENLQNISQMLRKYSSHFDLFVSPELALLGYPPRDLLSLPSVLEHEASALQKLGELSAELGVGVAVGHTEKTQSFSGRPLFNALTLWDAGKVVGTIRKTRIPSYDIFSEERFFESWPGGFQEPLEFRGKKIFFRICEDAWANIRAFGERDIRNYPALKSPASFDLEINLSASPYARGKRNTREDLFCAIAQRSGKPLLYTNAVGGQDEIIFDGGSFGVDGQGKILARAKLFSEDILSFDFDQGQLSPIGPHSNTPTHSFPIGHSWIELRQALVLGIRDFAQKSSQNQLLLGLSGGIDSALVATLCVEAMGAENVFGLSLPSALTSQISRDLAKKLASHLKISFEEVSIAESVKVQKDLLGLEDRGLPIENLQARNRGLFLMARSNQRHQLLISTGNKSETAMGYATLYGDMAGALSPIADLYKTEVYGLAALINLENEIIPWEIFHRVPTAELAPDQKDSDSLPSYEILDRVLRDLIENQGEARFKTDDLDKLLGAKGKFHEIRQKIFAYEFKRKQSAPLLRVHNRAFGMSWQMPIAKGKI